MVLVIEFQLAKNHEPDLEELSLKDLFTFIAGAICQQGIYKGKDLFSRILSVYVFQGLIFLLHLALLAL